MNWSLVSCQVDGEGEAGATVAVAMENGEIAALPAARGQDLLELIEAWPSHEEQLRALKPDRGERPNDGLGRVLAPLRFPRKLIMVGANYRSHLLEMGVELPKQKGVPFFFLKPPSTTIVGNGDAIRVPSGAALKVDWEAELGVVIGRTARAVSPEDALDYVAGYTILNDISARGAHRREDAVAPPFSFDWLGSKGRDTFCPMGPGVTPRWLIPDPNRLQLRLWVNDVLKQDASTSDMIFDIPTVISAASQSFTLEPGDVIGTGTPAGVGAPRGEFLRPGDVVRVRIELLGELCNPVELAEA